jgi:hypothetical protein
MLMSTVWRVQASGTQLYFLKQIDGGMENMDTCTLVRLLQPHDRGGFVRVAGHDVVAVVGVVRCRELLLIATATRRARRPGYRIGFTQVYVVMLLRIKARI